MKRLETCLIRPIAASDTDSFVSFADLAGDGMTTMPRDKAALIAKMNRSVKSFTGELKGADAEYFMVMEDITTSDIVGCTAVYPSIGQEFGFFSYRKMKQVQYSKELDIRAEVPVLHLTNEFTGYSEVGSLILHPDWRGTGGGKFLARARYLLIAEFPDLFSDYVLAEMRGYQDIDGNSPFWQSVGAKFFNMGFAEADHISAVQGNEFIADLMPAHPLYLDLLPEGVADIIGKPFTDSAPAMAMLLKEGFEYKGCVDVFDAGPQVTAKVGNIQTIRASTVGQLADLPSQGRFMCCTRNLNTFEVRLCNNQGKYDTRWRNRQWRDPALPVRYCAFI